MFKARVQGQSARFTFSTTTLLFLSTWRHLTNCSAFLTSQISPHEQLCFCFSILSESLSTLACLVCLICSFLNVTSCCLYFLKLRLGPKSPLIISNSDFIMSLPTALLLTVTQGVWFFLSVVCCAEYLHWNLLFRAPKPEVLLLARGDAAAQARGSGTWGPSADQGLLPTLYFNWLRC